MIGICNHIIAMIIIAMIANHNHNIAYFSEMMLLTLVINIINYQVINIINYHSLPCFVALRKNFK